MSVLSYSTPWALEHLHKGPLEPHIDGFAALLSEQGYAEHTARVKLRLAAYLSCWLHRRQLGLRDLDEQQVEKFLEYRRRHGFAHRGNAATLLHLIRHLREAGVIPVPVSQTDDNELLRLERGFSQYLVQERGLVQPTLINYLPYVQRFLSERFGTNNIVLDELRPPDISRFILRHAHNMSPGWAKLMVIALRSFFRYLLWRGDINTDLAAAVPTVADWRLSTLPRSLPPQDVERLLQSCDRATATGQRNYAILLLLARLGLRAGLNPARRGAHLLRHSLAFRMLQEGASLGEIGEILRHCLTNTTEIYTKISLAALRPLAQPWPGEEAVL